MQYWAVIPAAGIGARMDVEVPKQYLKINGKTILEHTLEKFCSHPLIEGIIVVIADNKTARPVVLIATLALTLGSSSGSSAILFAM